MSWLEPIWVCDKCDAIMNDQPGFNTYSGVWRCTECGALNSVSASDELDTDDMLRNGIDTFTRKPLWDPDDDDY